MDVLNSASEVIDALGGTKALADLTRVNHKAVSMWKSYGKFPWRVLVPINDALQKQGKVACHSLWGMRKEQARKRKP